MCNDEPNDEAVCVLTSTNEGSLIRKIFNFKRSHSLFSHVRFQVLQQCFSNHISERSNCKKALNETRLAVISSIRLSHDATRQKLLSLLNRVRLEAEAFLETIDELLNVVVAVCVRAELSSESSNEGNRIVAFDCKLAAWKMQIKFVSIF